MTCDQLRLCLNQTTPELREFFGRHRGPYLSKISHIIDVEYQQIDGKQFLRELSISKFPFLEVKCYQVKDERRGRYDELSKKSQWDLRYNKYQLTGLSIDPNPMKEFKTFNEICMLIQSQYDGDEKWMAYKGGHVERDLCLSLGINKLINLEVFGCPKYDILRINDDPVLKCYNHKFKRDAHCSRDEVYTFGKWVMNHLN